MLPCWLHQLMQGETVFHHLKQVHQHAIYKPQGNQKPCITGPLKEPLHTVTRHSFYQINSLQCVDCNYCYSVAALHNGKAGNMEPYTMNYLSPTLTWIPTQYYMVYLKGWKKSKLIFVSIWMMNVLGKLQPSILNLKVSVTESILASSNFWWQLAVSAWWLHCSSFCLQGQIIPPLFLLGLWRVLHVEYVEKYKFTRTFGTC